MYLRSPYDLCPFCIAATNSGTTTSKKPLHQFVFHMLFHNPQPSAPFSPSNGKEDGKKQQQPLLPVKLLVAPLTALTGESKAIKMTRRQIVCDTSKGLEKAGKLSNATSSSSLRREREEKKKHKADKHAPHGQHKHPETPALSSRPPPRPKHRLVPRDYTSNDYTIPALALRGAN